MFSPLAELHRHLDGSIRFETLVELATCKQLELPEDLPFQAGMGLEDALARFAFTLSVLQDPAAVERVAREMVEDAEQEGVSHLEIRFAPQLHQGAPLEEIVDAASSGVDGKAGLILCGLYGEAPKMLEDLVEVARHRPLVVGLDLAGGPAPFHTWGMLDYAPAFSLAREFGLGRTVHAGEGRPPQEIAYAIESLHAQRIGHGTTLLEDERVVEMVLKSGVTIEACPTSNVHVGAIASVAAHPLKEWLKRGVKTTLCSDNTFFSQTTAKNELEVMVASQQLSDGEIEGLIACGHQASFRR